MSNATDSDEWKRLLYSEAWALYRHEDDLGQSGNNYFLTVQTALIALLTLIAKPVLETDPTHLSNLNIQAGVTAFGFLALVIGAISLGLDSYWKSAIKAGRASLSIRWCTARILESERGLEKCGPASLEDRWRAFSRENPGLEYQPFAESNNLGQTRVPPLPETRGWSSMLKVVTVFQYVHWTMVAAGIVLIALGISG